MKVILSRKGFDSKNGGSPSVILPNGEMLSFPIPGHAGDVRYGDVRKTADYSIEEFITMLGLKVKASDVCHVDPDLMSGSLSRQVGWKPIFGQCDAAATHLTNKGVQVGDLFLFFGWFRRTKQTPRGVVWDTSDKGRHVIYGYMEIGQILSIDDPTTEVPAWASYHPHMHPQLRSSLNNRLYIAREHLSGTDSVPGAGMLRFTEDLALSIAGRNRTEWQLPEFFRNVSISYHSPDSWKDDHFKAADRGQEFVVDESEAVTEWARSLVLNSKGCP